MHFFYILDPDLEVDLHLQLWIRIHIFLLGLNPRKKIYSYNFRPESAGTFFMLLFLELIYNFEQVTHTFVSL